MSRLPSTFPRTNSATQISNSNSVPDAVNDLDLSTFLDLMIAEMQNQDPLNPLDNKDMLAQISQLREVGATDKLTQTLNSVLLGQNLSSATALLGSDISAVTDEGESIQGVVSRIEIADGDPKIHLDKNIKAAPHTGEGDIKKGKYNYRVVWQGEDGALKGIELSGAKAVNATGDRQSIEISHLPISKGPKQIYRTDAEGNEPFRLVDTIVDGSQGTFVDRLADDDRSLTQFTTAQWDNDVDLWTAARSYTASLKNVSEIRPAAEE